jgi:hypothetical protein
VSDLENRISALEREIAEIRNEQSLIPSIQRSYLELSARVTALEKGWAQRPDSVVLHAESAPPFAPFGSVEKLVEYVERLFDCRDGDHRNAHWVYNPERGDYDYLPYRTLGLLAPATVPDAQERLRQALGTSFHKLRLTCKSDRPVLYWRYAVQERILEDNEIATELKSVEPVKYKIMTRVAIPEADFSEVGNLVKSDGTIYATLQG